MNEYSFLQGVIDAGLILKDFAEKECFEDIYKKAPTNIKGYIDKVTREGIDLLLNSCANILVNKIDLFSEKLVIQQSVCLKDFLSDRLSEDRVNDYCNAAGLDIIDSSINIGKCLQDTYNPIEFDKNSYDAGLSCVYFSFKKIYDQIPSFVKIFSMFVGKSLTKMFDETKNLIKSRKKSYDVVKKDNFFALTKPLNA